MVVNFNSDNDCIIVADGITITISESDAKALADRINEYFIDDDLEDEED